jgi:transcription termination factor NusB
LYKNKNKKNNKFTTSIKIITSYISDTFPNEKGTFNDFIKGVLAKGVLDDKIEYLETMKQAIKKNKFYAIETVDDKILNNVSPPSSKKNKHL